MKDVLLIADVLVDVNDDNETTYSVGFVRTIYQNNIARNRYSKFILLYTMQ